MTMVFGAMTTRKKTQRDSSSRRATFNSSFVLRFSARSCLRGIDRVLQPRFRLDANKAVDDFAAFENHKRWNARDIILDGCALRIISIQLADFDSGRILAGQLFDNGSNHPARTAPRRPEVHKHRDVSLQYFGLEIVVVKLRYAHR
jgi:hypothetical protein